MNACLRLFCALLWLALPLAASADALEERNFLGGKVAMLVPTDFAPMDEEMLRIKYPMERRPTEVVTNQSGSFNVAFNHTTNRVQPEQLEQAHASITKMFHNRYPSATWYRDEMTEIDGRKAFVLELVTPAVDTRIHNIMLATSVDGRMLLVSVNLVEELKAAHLADARKMAASIRVKD